MLATITSSRNKSPRPFRGFTLIEILVAVGIIVVLMAILIPAIAAVKVSAKKASSRSVLSSLRTGLAAYYNDFNFYPDSHPASTTTGTYGAGNNIIGPRRGPALLAQALMGYLPGSLDGAGPDTNAAYAADPRLGFRTRNTIMPAGGVYTTATAVGKVYGPYAPDDPASYKINDKNSATDPTLTHDQSFYDSFGNEILYFRARPANPTRVLIFHDSTAGSTPIFFSDDCSAAAPNSTALAPVAPVASAFFNLIAGQQNSGPFNTITSYPGPILGADTYLLISAGPDAQYFTGDDIVMTDH